MTRLPNDQWPPELHALAYLDHPDGRKLIPVQSVAALFSCGLSNLREMRRQGKLAATVYRQGNVHYFDRENVAAAYLDKYPLKIVRPGEADSDALEAAQIDALPFLQRRGQAEPGASETPSEVAQSERQEMVRQMGAALTVAVEAALTPVLHQVTLLQEDGAQKSAIIDTQQGTIDGQQATIDGLGRTVEAQRAEMERMTRASEERQRPWWARLAGRKG